MRIVEHQKRAMPGPEILIVIVQGGIFVAWSVALTVVSVIPRVVNLERDQVA